MSLELPVYYAADLEKAQIPAEVLHAWIVASDGVYRFTRNRVFQAVVKVDAEPFGEMVDGIEMVTPIPWELMERTVRFFRAVYDEHKAEAAVYLAFKNGTWDIHVPNQRVSGASVDYDPPPPGIGIAGSIHSHASMGAFHSGTDEHDELDFDGVHITVGRLDKAEAEFACSLVVSGVRQKCELKEVVEMPPPPPKAEVPKTWMERVKRDAIGFVIGGDDDWPLSDGLGGYYSGLPRSVQDYTQRWLGRGSDDNVSRRVANINREKAKGKEAGNGKGHHKGK